MPWAYLSRDALKARLGHDSETSDDATYRAVLEGVSRQIDNLTGRSFQPRTATLAFTAKSPTWLDVRDLISVTSIGTDHDGDGTYERSWASTDYDLKPDNAAFDEHPYERILVALRGVESFPTISRGVQVSGVWGYWQELASVGTLGAALDSSATSVTMASGHAIEPLMTLLIDDEQLYVTAVNGVTLALYGRGMNGTTAAAHDSGATVRGYRYPAPVVEACAIQAARIFRRKDAPFGIAGSPELGQTSVIPRLDPDVKQLLRDYRRWNIGAV